MSIQFSLSNICAELSIKISADFRFRCEIFSFDLLTDIYQSTFLCSSAEFKIGKFMNFHGLSFDSINPFFTRSSFFLFIFLGSRPINEQKKSYKIKIIDYTTKCWKKGKSYENSSLAFLKIKFLSPLFYRYRSRWKALQSSGGIETFLMGLNGG